MASDVRKRLLSAQKAIKAKQYDKARKLLKGVDHPKAREWLAKLEKHAPSKKWSVKEYSIFAVGITTLTIILLLIGVTQFNNAIQQTEAQRILSDSITEVTIIETATPRPLTDSLAINIKESVFAIERIEGVSSIKIPGRDEIQYDMTIRLYDDANLNETLESISRSISDYQALPSSDIAATVTLNVFVVQGMSTENWRYTGSQWIRRAIDGLEVTATPYPTPLPYDLNPPPQGAPVVVTSSRNNNTSSSINYAPKNCEEAVAMGLSAEQAAQYPNLDRDNDGVACYGD